MDQLDNKTGHQVIQTYRHKSKYIYRDIHGTISPNTCGLEVNTTAHSRCQTAQTKCQLSNVNSLSKQPRPHARYIEHQLTMSSPWMVKHLRSTPLLKTNNFSYDHRRFPKSLGINNNILRNNVTSKRHLQWLVDLINPVGTLMTVL